MLNSNSMSYFSDISASFVRTLSSSNTPGSENWFRPWCGPCPVWHFFDRGLSAASPVASTCIPQYLHQSLEWNILFPKARSREPGRGADSDSSRHHYDGLKLFRAIDPNKRVSFPSCRRSLSASFACTVEIQAGFQLLAVRRLDRSLVPSRRSTSYSPFSFSLRP